VRAAKGEERMKEFEFKNLSMALSEETQRVRELLCRYQQLSEQASSKVCRSLRKSIRQGGNALAGGDGIKMLYAYRELRSKE